MPVRRGITVTSCLSSDTGSQDKEKGVERTRN